ncbi:MAG: helix-turn-helix transcriptional regulator [Bacilli bacterium]|nr:helix-turn-helix transcriptional regulator [Bacilli bacterium]
MENKNKDFEARKKFASLVSILAKEGFSFAFIEHKIIHDPFFLFFENNDHDSFLAKPIEEIVLEVYGKRIYMDYGEALPGELVWASQMYVTLLLNYEIPLQRSFLAFPIIKMLSFFEPYHEMGDYAFCQRYLEEEKRTSILKLLLHRGISIRRLSTLLGIKQPTLQSYMDNEKLFAMSLENARKISDFFAIPIAAISWESLYVPDTALFLEDESFKEWFISLLAAYWNLDEVKVDYSANAIGRQDVKASLSMGRIVVDPHHFVMAKRQNNATAFDQLSETEIRFLQKKAIAHLKETLPEGQLLF